MRDRKVLYIILLIVGILLIALGLFLSNRLNPEKLPDIEPIQQVEEQTVEEEVVVEEPKQEETTTEPSVKKLTPSKPKPKATAPKINPNFIKNQPSETAQSTEENLKRKLTPEEEALIKKVPPSKEIVVDKEIKIKSSGKYFFK